jgi:hypothetical protein
MKLLKLIKNYFCPYRKLLKIKTPVLLEIGDFWQDSNYSKCRILYPCGYCEYIYLYGLRVEFRESCFLRQGEGLLKTVARMKKYDEFQDSHIVDTQEL